MKQLAKLRKEKEKNEGDDSNALLKVAEVLGSVGGPLSHVSCEYVLSGCVRALVSSVCISKDAGTLSACDCIGKCVFALVSTQTLCLHNIFRSWCQ